MASIYFFEDGIEDKMLLGNKGGNLVTMAKLGLPVPPGFGISIEAYRNYHQTGQLPLKELDESIARLERKVGKALGKGLLVSVRSSAPVSMPGMMDTVLNVGDRATLISAAKRVFDSWDNMRAVEYRRLNKISSEMGTACIVQAMVMGNKDSKSGTGVVFSRNPSNGERGLFGEWLGQAQGEDLVSGARTPEPVAKLRQQMPELYTQLEQVAEQLERHFKDMQDIEFTIESGVLYTLQTRSGKRSGQASVKIAVDMVKEGILTRDEAVLRVTPEDLRTLLFKRLRSPEAATPIAQGLVAAPGAAVGRVVFNPAEAVRLAKKNEKIILVRPETSPDDIQGIAAADAVLTSRGGLTSHAAIVTRAMGKPCVCGAEEVAIDLEKGVLEARGHKVHKGEEVTLDGNTGMLYLGSLPLIEAEVTVELGELLSWADGIKRLGVRANADTADMIVKALEFGAEGIGLCRTERQFNAPERLSVIREYILAATPAQKGNALERLRQLQTDDFEAIFKVMQGKPVIIRLLDLPLHEFLPSEADTRDPEMKKRIHALKEVNPMLGHRGVRLGVTNPEIYLMQINAVLEARSSVPADVSVMIPQVITLQELLYVRRNIKDPSLKVGVMMETVRACLRADKLAEVADFFSFGTNDLTQAVYSFSREDAEKKYLTTYLDLGILQDNPFEVVDIKGAGRLMELAVSWARAVKPNLDIGVCGEHGGEPRSIKFFHSIGVSYVSCSAPRIPVAKLAAAQAVLEERKRSEAMPKVPV
ncbi:MAG: pyruvate, phosphate dikinase [Chloroflexi bacterium]|nr:pyruvate, phosphate dikinase [Chloroflexota bacterium]